MGLCTCLYTGITFGATFFALCFECWKCGFHVCFAPGMNFVCSFPLLPPPALSSRSTASRRCSGTERRWGHLPREVAPKFVPRAKQTWNSPGWGWFEAGESAQASTQIGKRVYKPARESFSCCTSQLTMEGDMTKPTALNREECYYQITMPIKMSS